MAASQIQDHLLWDAFGSVQGTEQVHLERVSKGSLPDSLSPEIAAKTLFMCSQLQRVHVT
jgi:hypothetical protein